MIRVLLGLLMAVSLTACGDERSNDKPRYGKEYGLPTNCRALVQAAVDDYRNKKYSADDVMASLERNCGASGSLW